jgi:hypothetical protein
MARSKSSSARSIVLSQKVIVEISEVPIEPFESLRHLDVERLSRAKKARFEIGTIDSGCCRRIAYAIVQNGKVTRLDLEPCTTTVRITPEIRRTIEAAVKKLDKGRRDTTSLPVPVDQFLARQIGPSISVWQCIRLCCFGHCITCCFHIPGVKGHWIWLGCAIDALPVP